MTAFSLIRVMLIKIIFVITISILVTPGNASEGGSINHPCNDYTFANCNPGQEFALFVTETIEQCQERCSDSNYKDECGFFIFSSEKPHWNCMLFHQPMQDYLDQCNVTGGPPEPSISQCLESDDMCKGFVSGDCSYDGDVVLELPTSPAEKCQETCQGFLDCQYFKYDEDNSMCYLLDSTTRSCKFFYGTQLPPIQECIGSTTSPSPITTTPGSVCPTTTNSTGGSWTQLENGQCYLYEASWKEKSDAHEYCAVKGGHLVEVTTKEESELIHNNNQMLGITSYYWLGLTKTGSNWKWENEGDADFTNWGSNEPDGDCYNGPPCNCAIIDSSTMEWYDRCCDTVTSYVLCEANPIKSP